MSDTSTGNHNGAGWYDIRLKGHLDSRWAAWFDGLSLSRPSRPPESSHREQRRAHPKARRCSHAHQEPRGDCRATRGGHIATETGQADDRRPAEPSGIGSITAPLNIEREGTHVFHRTRRGKDRPPALALGLIAAAQFVVIMDTSIIGVAFAV